MTILRLFIVVQLAFASGCARGAMPLCVMDQKSMPEKWQPTGNVHQSLNQARWTNDESSDAAQAVRLGLDELAGFFAGHPSAIASLGTDSVEVFLDTAYSASNMPDVEDAAAAYARKAVGELTAVVLRHDPVRGRCDDLQYLLSLAIYTHQLHTDSAGAMTGLANAAFHACGSLDRAIGFRNDLWNRVMWSIEFTDAQTVPGLDLPAGVRAFPQNVWQALNEYPFIEARAYADGAANETFYQTAYLATHMAYIVTGYGRHAIYIEDSPRLYAFLRENFYPVLELGELDLVAEFADLFRQYGCTESNDLQLRDATRYLMRLFHAAGDRWMAHREPYEAATISDYDLVHKAWTGIAGVRPRVPESPQPGTYGAVVRQWLMNQR